MRLADLSRESVIAVRADDTVLDAARKMRRFHVGDLVVLDAGEALHIPIGILTDRDIAVGLVAEEVTDVAGLLVQEILPSRELVTVGCDDDVETAVALMRENGVRRLPVVDERGVLAGIFTLDDAVAHLSRTLATLAEVAGLQIEDERRGRI